MEGERKMFTFSERKELSEEYNKWIKSEDGFEIKDCTESVIVFVQDKIEKKFKDKISRLEKHNEELANALMFKSEVINENEELKNNQVKLAVEKLEDLLKYYYEYENDFGESDIGCELTEYGMFVRIGEIINELKGRG